jgi:hypothetical protein
MLAGDIPGALQLSQERLDRYENDDRRLPRASFAAPKRTLLSFRSWSRRISPALRRSIR